ncbi:hypothetical protein SLS58_002850 [Diplodia intermedia]|uniref:ubiquitinyl hydrolase 1 n=1 Tax=Diplodia intermedia TaxID=856260 RepID=A0ABR3TXS6_9PEZI
MSRLVLCCVKRNAHSLTAAINSVWPGAAGAEERRYSPPEIVHSRSRQFIKLKVDHDGSARQQVLYYDPMEGGLFIDGKPLSQLPAEYRDNCILNELFGSQNIFTYPSFMPGMDYTMNFAPKGHQIHFGVLQKSLVIRARHRGRTLQLIPRDVFGGFEKLDLPASLVENCIHWLDLTTGVLEVRQKPDIWIQRDSNWIVDVRCRLARRRRVSLVDRGSHLFKRVASIFRGFEHPARLTVYQPEAQKGSLSVELRRLDLNFEVNENGRLYCRELQAEVDRDQDAGTWYGFESKIVLRDSRNPRQRRILVALGPLSWTRRGMHVAVHAENCGNYGIFTVNNVLGRLECPAEARLLLFKALLHAYTASIVPDPLTRRSGTEEALHCLRAGQNQPWMPFNPMIAQYLHLLARLTPKRVYYPLGRKAMQQIFWDNQLPTATKHDAFHSAVEAIQHKSASLSAFWLTEPIAASSPDAGSSHLRKRSGIRRSSFTRIDLNCVSLDGFRDVLYRSRDRQTQTDRRARVLESTTAINTWRANFPVIPNLALLLQGWPVLQARGDVAGGLLLTSILGADAATEWGSWLSFCRRARVAAKYPLCFTLGALAFQPAIDMNLVRILVAFAILEDLKELELPPWTSYRGFKHDEAPSAHYLLQLVVSSSTSCASGSAGAAGAHREHADADCQRFADFLASQWPQQLPSVDGAMEECFAFMDVPGAMSVVREDWTRLQRNAELSAWVTRVQSILNRLHIGTHTHVTVALSNDTNVILKSRRKRDVPCLEDLLSKLHTIPIPASGGVLGTTNPRSEDRRDSPLEHRSPVDEAYECLPPSSEVPQLENIIAEMTCSRSAVRKSYGRDLDLSLQALKAARRSSTSQRNHQSPPSRLKGSVEQAHESVMVHFEHISEALDAGDSRVAWLKHGGLWPCISPVTLLERLRTTAKAQLGDCMKRGLIKYGQSITALQQRLRIDDAWMRENANAAAEEAGNPGHETWDPTKYPDWLLIEIDGDFLIRPHQVDVALSTISPPSGSNSVLQLNMGQGKTSCIIPIIASVLADTQRLVRIVVPRALLVQTAQVLQARLGNLLGREVRSVPFSRRTSTAVESIDTFIDIHEDIMSRCGVILTLPENILSFKLSVTQRLLDGKHGEAGSMAKAQKWMDEVSRDILDECDFTLATRTQLIYPSGPQASLDGHPFRWQTAQALLELVRSHLEQLKEDFPRSIEVVDRESGGFPWLFFLRPDAESALIQRIADCIAGGRTRLLSLANCSQEDRNAVRRFIGNVQPQVDDEGRIEAIFTGESPLRKTVYLLRGLLAHGILILALKKRWNVQYGLHPLRDPVSVPYHAKGVPSDQAEWGHPDVAIVLTCLSFYFAGLSVAQLRECVLHILQADDPAGEYGLWAGTSTTLPRNLQEWSVLNVDDELQLHELWTHLRYNISVIGCFLNNFVFPIHAKQFRTQIHASGWDLPLRGRDELRSTPASKGKHVPLTTGFSGTNDNRYLLPLTIEQHDLSTLVHTNADVLTYLLQPRNRGYVLAASQEERFSEEALLRKMKDLEIRVLIDAGAQILEMDNLTLVKAWMRIDTQAKAALYFNLENKPYVLYRSGMQVPLLASSMLNNLSECLVYLDEAHTRGTDLKLPADARAAMRLRQLATTQSIVFFAPPEVHQGILDHSGRRSGEHPDSSHVLQWLLEQTCRGIEQLHPLYHSQGIDFYRRFEVSLRYPNHLVNKQHREAFVQEIRHVENQTLQDMYQPRWCSEAEPLVLKQASKATAAQLEKLKRHDDSPSKQNVGAVSSTALREVEQEREVAHEVEAVRKVQQPPCYKALPYGGLHADILHFEKTGKLKTQSDGYELLSDAIERTSTSRKHATGAVLFCHHIFVSRELFRTVELE